MIQKQLIDTKHVTHCLSHKLSYNSSNFTFFHVQNVFHIQINCPLITPNKVFWYLILNTSVNTELK